jgi:phosphatidate cytidylyltransferase
MMPMIELDAAGTNLFLVIFSILAVATAGNLLWSLLHRAGERPSLLDEIQLRTQAWWIIAVLLCGSLMFGFWGVWVLFALISFQALREYLTLTPTRRADHGTLFASFFLIFPAHYLLIAWEWYGLYSIFIPVYGFLFVPARVALSGDCERFLERTSKIQWGLMTFVYFVGYVPALFQLEIPGFEGQHYKLVLYLVIIIGLGDVLQFVFGKAFGRRKIAPSVSPNKTWAGLLGGLFGAALLGWCFTPVTPFGAWQSALLAFVVTGIGFLGGLTMSAIKRDRGVKDFGTILPGHGGIIDRIDSLSFAAPLFFHLVRYFFTV